MATQTTNLGLAQPIGTEQVSRQVINTNMELIDSAIGAVPEGENLQEEIEYVQEHVADLIDDTAGAGDDDKVWSADKTALELDKKANAIEMKIATPAAVMTFQDGADNQAIALEIPLEPVQDLHGYDYPWPGGGGKNKLDDVNWLLRGSYSSMGQYTADGKYISYAIESLPAGTYTFSTDLESCYIPRYLINNISSTVGAVQSFTFTLSETANFKVTMRKQDNSDISTITPHSMIELGSQATAYASYSNICPISGWTGAKVTRTGKNLFNKNGTNFIKGYFNIEKFVANNNQGTYYFKCVRGKTYTVSKTATSATGRMGIACCHSIPPTDGMPISQSTSKSSFSVGERASLTITADDDYLLVWAYRKNNDEESIDTLQLEEGSAATAYEPYAGTEHQVSWQTEAGIVYGGTLTVNKDGSGVLVATHSIVDMGDITYNPLTIGSVNAFQFEILDGDNRNINVKGNNATEKSYYCTCYRYFYSKRDILETNDCAISEYNLSTSYDLCVRDDRYSTASEIKTALAGQKLVFEIKTPTPYPLSASQVKSILGLNNVWADTGNINSVEYPADTKMYIDHLNDPTEDDFIANNNIAANEYFAIGNDLYRATQSIPANNPIIPDTNCENLSLPEILNSFMTGSGVSF